MVASAAWPAPTFIPPCAAFTPNAKTNKTRRDRNHTGPGLLRVHAFVSLRPYRNRNRVPAFGAVYSPFCYGSKLIVKFLEGVLEFLSYRNRFGSLQISARGDKPI